MMRVNVLLRRAARRINKLRSWMFVLQEFFARMGPRMPLFDGHLIPDFITNALDGKDLEILRR